MSNYAILCPKLKKLKNLKFQFDKENLKIEIEKIT